LTAPVDTPAAITIPSYVQSIDEMHWRSEICIARLYQEMEFWDSTPKNLRRFRDNVCEYLGLKGDKCRLNARDIEEFLIDRYFECLLERES
jgi:hypothetical protein